MELIRAMRKACKLSQGDLAELAGVSSASISRWERGNRIPDVQTFEALVSALGGELCVVFE